MRYPYLLHYHITYSLYINTKFRERLINLNVANELFSYLFFSGIVLLVQVILLNYMISLINATNASSGAIYMSAFLNLLL